MLTLETCSEQRPVVSHGRRAAIPSPAPFKRTKSGCSRVLNLVRNSGRDFCSWLRGRSYWVVGDDLLHSRRELRALAAPVGDPIMLQVDAGRVSAGIVGAHNLDG